MVEKLILIDTAGHALDSKRVSIAFKMAKAPVLKNLFTYLTTRFLVRDILENA